MLADGERQFGQSQYGSGRWDSNPRPRPWQGRALPLSYARIRSIHIIPGEGGGKDLRRPAALLIVRAMPPAPLTPDHLFPRPARPRIPHRTYPPPPPLTLPNPT